MSVQADYARFFGRELATVRDQLLAYPDNSSVWVLPNGLPNSAGTLALHIAGNLRWFIGAQLGGSGYVRDRDAEGSEDADRADERSEEDLLQRASPPSPSFPPPLRPTPPGMVLSRGCASTPRPCRSR